MECAWTLWAAKHLNHGKVSVDVSSWQGIPEHFPLEHKNRKWDLAPEPGSGVHGRVSTPSLDAMAKHSQVPGPNFSYSILFLHFNPLLPSFYALRSNCLSSIILNTLYALPFTVSGMKVWLSSFLREQNWGHERLINLPVVIQLELVRARMWPRFVWLQSQHLVSYVTPPPEMSPSEEKAATFWVTFRVQCLTLSRWRKLVGWF